MGKGKKKKIIKLLAPWELLDEMPEGYPIQVMKGPSNSVEFSFRCSDGSSIALFNFTEAAPREGIMQWQDYKGRTKDM